MLLEVSLNHLPIILYIVMHLKDKRGDYFMNIEKWIDSVLENTLPEQVIAIAFNLYEDIDNQWSIEMVGTNSFDTEDADWVCDEVFNTRDELQSWTQKSKWEVILQEVSDKIKIYIQTGKYSEKLKSYQGVGVGFVDGDIIIVYQQ